MTGPQRQAREELRRAVQAARDGCVERVRENGHPGGARRVMVALRRLRDVPRGEFEKPREV